MAAGGPSSHYPRDIAVRVLTRVLSDRQPLDEALAAVTGEVSPAARAWLQEVCSGTLRWRGRLDMAIDSTALKKKPSGWLRKILLVAAYQLIVQERTAPAAVVNETVSEVKRKEGEAPAKFANAALRKISAHAKEWRELQAPPQGSTLTDSARWASLPEWLWKRLVAGRGREWAQEYARASLERPKLWVRSRDRGGPETWGEGWSGGVKAGPVPGSFEVLEGGAVTSKTGFVEGAFFVQDISSQTLVDAISLQARAETASSGRVPQALDLCAAPGGKSVGMAWSGLSVAASDRDEARYALLSKTVERVAPEVKIVARDQVAGLEPLDLVWVDSPCSGTGILRRHPDVRWLRQEGELEGLQKVQQELLSEAWGKVRPGGLLAYSVCSVLPEEGKGAIEKFLRVSGVEAEVLNEWLLVPQVAPSGDGFWATLLKKKS
jgi:16S rRNA (cytosine967-C5)-methyltransferase